MSRFTETLRQAWRAVRQRGSVLLAGSGLFLLAFMLGLHLFFPTTALRQWLLAEVAARTSASMQIETLSLAPLFSLRGEQATLAFDGNTAPAVVLDAFRLVPRWTTLLTGNPGLALEATLLGGHLEATWRRDGELALQVEGLKLSDISVSPDSRARLSGTIVTGKLRKDSPAKKPAETLLATEIDAVTLTVMGQPLPLGKVSLQGSGKGNALRITSLTATGGGVAITGSGSLLLGTSAAASRLQLDLTVRPAASAPASLAAGLELAARRQADGSYRLQLSGAPGRLTVEPSAPGGRQRSEPAEEE